MPSILLAAGFRPFFAFAQLYGALTIGLWAAAYWGALGVPGPLAPSLIYRRRMERWRVRYVARMLGP